MQRNGHDTVVRALLQHSATANAQNADGFTPLHWAALQGHIHVARLLLGSAADAGARTHKRTTALHLAANFGRGGVARLLLGMPEEEEKAEGDTVAGLGEEESDAVLRSVSDRAAVLRLVEVRLTLRTVGSLCEFSFERA